MGKLGLVELERPQGRDALIGQCEEEGKCHSIGRGKPEENKENNFESVVRRGHKLEGAASGQFYSISCLAQGCHGSNADVKDG